MQAEAAVSMRDTAAVAVLPNGPGRVRLVELPDRSAPAGSDVLVRMIRAPINPADLLAIDGQYSVTLGASDPLGAEGVGMVEAVGSDVADLRPGDLVLPLTRGNWCSMRLIDRQSLWRLPPDIDVEQAAMVRINPPTARLMLDAVAARAGEVVVQNGATSAVAHWVRRIGAERGITVIDIVRRPDAALPDALLDGPGLAERVRAVAGDRRVVAALDCVAGEATGQLAECLARGGRLLVFGHLSGAPISVRSQLLTGGGLTIGGFSLRPAESALDADARATLFAEAVATVMADSSAPPVRAVLPLTDIEAAIAQARDGGRGRVQIDLTR